MAHMVNDTVVLNDTERELFNTLLEAVQVTGTGTVLRCAGGWVRDKLLGKDSLDIDIALDNMLGKDFADKVWCMRACVPAGWHTYFLVWCNPPSGV